MFAFLRTMIKACSMCFRCYLFLQPLHSPATACENTHDDVPNLGQDSVPHGLFALFVNFSTAKIFSPRNQVKESRSCMTMKQLRRSAAAKLTPCPL